MMQVMYYLPVQVPTLKRVNNKTGLLVITLLFFLFADGANANCWVDAGERYAIDPWLLIAISKTESQFNPHSLNKNKNGSWDYGLMQINSSHMKTLEQMGIGVNELAEPCQQIMVGAWLLAKNIKKYGNTWNAVGAYNVGCAKLDKDECARRRTIYVNKVKSAYKTLGKRNDF